MVGMVLVMAVGANRFRDLFSNAGSTGGRRVSRAGTVADLALYVSKRVLGVTDAIAEFTAESHDVAGDANGLEMAMLVEQGLVGRGVGGGLPLRELRLVAASACLGPHISFMLPERIRRERRDDPGLSGG